MISKERVLFSGNYSRRGNCGWLAVPMVGLGTALSSRELSGYLKGSAVQVHTCCMYMEVYPCEYTRTKMKAVKEEIGVDTLVWLNNYYCIIFVQKVVDRTKSKTTPDVLLPGNMGRILILSRFI